MPALTFVATANAVSYCGATPHFVDCRSAHARRRRGRAGRHLRGVAEFDATASASTVGPAARCAHSCPCMSSAIPSTLDALDRRRAGWHSGAHRGRGGVAGLAYRGRHTGTFGPFGTLSFNGNKTITTGGGGAILTDDAGLAKRAKHLTTTAQAAAPLGTSFTTRSATTTGCRTSTLRSAARSSSSSPASSSRKRRLDKRYARGLRGLCRRSALRRAAGTRAATIG